MDIKTTQVFKGSINGIEIDDQARFNLLEYLLREIIVVAGGEVFNNNFIKDLDYLIDDLYLNTEHSYGDIENMLLENIQEANRFEDIVFDNLYLEDYFQEINQRIRDGYYID